MKNFLSKLANMDVMIILRDIGIFMAAVFFLAIGIHKTWAYDVVTVIWCLVLGAALVVILLSIIKEIANKKKSN